MFSYGRMWLTPRALRAESAGGLEDLLGLFVPDGRRCWLPLPPNGECGCDCERDRVEDSGGGEEREGEGMSGMEPCGLALDMLWLRLLSSPPRSSRSRGVVEFEVIDMCMCARPRPVALPFPLALICGLGMLTRPSASPVMITCRFFSLRSNSACSSTLRFASSSFSASSSSESVLCSDEDGDVGSRCTRFFFRREGPWPRTVMVEEEAFFDGREALSEVSRARTPRAVPFIRLDDEDSTLVRLDAWYASAGFSWMNGKSSGRGVTVADGLSAPLDVMSCSPRRSSSYLICARYRRYGSGTSRWAASAFPT